MFERAFLAEVNINQRVEVCLGYQFHLPELSSIGKASNTVVKLTMIKGPGETPDADHELILPESTFD